MTSKRLRKTLFAVLRLVVCVGLLWLVLRGVTVRDRVTTAEGEPRTLLRPINAGDETALVKGPDGGPVEIPLEDLRQNAEGGVTVTYGLAHAVRSSDRAALIVCLLVFVPVPFLQSLRFQWMLRAQEIHITYWESLKLSVAGNFLNFIAALGSTGGDVFKAYYVCTHTDRRTEAITTVLLDRIVGLASMVLIAALVCLFHDNGTQPMRWVRIGSLIVLAGIGLCVVILTTHHARRLLEPGGLLGSLPLIAYLRRVEAASRRLVLHRTLALGSLALTVLLQAIAIASFVFAAYALHMRITTANLLDYYAYIAAGAVIMAVPVSVQGLGMVEWAYVQFFLDTHGTLPQLLCLAMAVRLIMLFWALPGVLVTMTGAYRPAVARRSGQQDIAPLPRAQP